MSHRQTDREDRAKGRPGVVRIAAEEPKRKQKTRAWSPGVGERNKARSVEEEKFGEEEASLSDAPRGGTPSGFMQTSPGAGSSPTRQRRFREASPQSPKKKEKEPEQKKREGVWSPNGGRKRGQVGACVWEPSPLWVQNVAAVASKNPQKLRRKLEEQRQLERARDEARSERGWYMRRYHKKFLDAARAAGRRFLEVRPLISPTACRPSSDGFGFEPICLANGHLVSRERQRQRQGEQQQQRFGGHPRPLSCPPGGPGYAGRYGGSPKHPGPPSAGRCFAPGTPPGALRSATPNEGGPSSARPPNGFEGEEEDDDEEERRRQRRPQEVWPSAPPGSSFPEDSLPRAPQAKAVEDGSSNSQAEGSLGKARQAPAGQASSRDQDFGGFVGARPLDGQASAPACKVASPTTSLPGVTKHSECMSSPLQRGPASVSSPVGTASGARSTAPGLGQSPGSKTTSGTATSSGGPLARARKREPNFVDLYPGGGRADLTEKMEEVMKPDAKQLLWKATKKIAMLQLTGARWKSAKDKVAEAEHQGSAKGHKGLESHQQLKVMHDQWARQHREVIERRRRGMRTADFRRRWLLQLHQLKGDMKATKDSLVRSMLDAFSESTWDSCGVENPRVAQERLEQEALEALKGDEDILSQRDDSWEPDKGEVPMDLDRTFDFELTEEDKMMRAMARNTGVPIFDVEAIHKEFQKWDLDNSGFIDFDELRALLTHMHHGMTPTPQQIQDALGALDADRSGKIEFGEFFPWYAEEFLGTAF